ncbi:hypothetical protein IGI37_001151 [Enterococcus sp. AZ194]|uniref:DUF1697 domain-containing protein n=1 Tax=Enterococcus sp. AZ194 TaxID=2774629 RepID=UPI003F26D5B4
MKRYVALLRGINVGGKNKLSMAELIVGFTMLGLMEVRTHLNSGNVIFSSEIENKQQLSSTIQSMITERFDLEILVHVVLQEELLTLLEKAPNWWGQEDKSIYDNLIFILEPFTYEEIAQHMGLPNTEYEWIEPSAQAIFWSFIRKDHQKTNWWAKTASSAVREKITIRTANTVRKIATM